MKRLIAALCGVGLAAAAIGVGGIATATVAGATPTCGQTGYTGTLPCLAVSPTAPLAITGTHTVTVHGYGFHPGDTIVVTVCNSDATLPDPAVQFAGGTLATDACGVFGGPAEGQGTATTAGKVTVALSLTAGQTGANALSSCAVDQAQATEGVNCVIAGLDNTSTSAYYGQDASAGLFFAPPATMATSDSYVGGTGDAVAYSATLTSSGEYTPSGNPPNGMQTGPSSAVANPEVPNNGGFATVGLVIEGTATAPTTAPSGDAYVGGVLVNTSTGEPATCQASSTPGATVWEGEQICSYGYATGEPIYIALHTYYAPTINPVFASPNTQPDVPSSTTYPEPTIPTSSGTVLGVSLFPLDACTVGVDGCTTGITISAGAGYGASDPGGFVANASNVPALGGLDSGTFSFEAIGATTGAKQTSTLKLLDGNFGPASHGSV